MIGEVCTQLERIMSQSEEEYQHSLDAEQLSAIGLDTLRGLQELDNQAPLRAATAQGPGIESSMRINRRGLQPPEAVDDTNERPSKVRKSERFDKIIFAKTANRVRKSSPSSAASESSTEPPGVQSPRQTLQSKQEKQHRNMVPDILLNNSETTSNGGNWTSG